jgi:hypothetical protein
VSKPIFPVIRERAPVLDFFRQRAGVTAGNLTTSQRQMAEEFRRGMADALGVPPEAIREEIVQKWVVNWTRAFVKPEYWAEVAPTTDRIRELGRELGEIVRSALPARGRLDLMRQAQPPQAEQPQRTKEEPYFSSLSIVRS